MDFATLKLPMFENREWVECDEQMFHACFTILGQYVENQLGRQQGDDGHRGYRLHGADQTDPKAIDLWLWYRDDLPQIIDEVEADLQACYPDHKDVFTVEEDEQGHTVLRSNRVRAPKFSSTYVDDLKDEKLSELMLIRRGLWT